MTVKQTSRTAHSEPIYFVELQSTAAGMLLVTNTESSGHQVGYDGYAVQYRQTINVESGSCTCGCPGFQESIARRAARDGVTPTIHNGRACKHIRKSAESGREWRYIDDARDAQPVPVAAPAKAAQVDYVAYFNRLNR
jgi:hypothetical protein